jgi:hypothetical protein
MTWQLCLDLENGLKPAEELFDPIARLKKLYGQLQRRLASAKAEGDHSEAQHLRKLLEQTKHVLDLYGVDP